MKERVHRVWELLMREAKSRKRSQRHKSLNSSSPAPLLIAAVLEEKHEGVFSVSLRSRLALGSQEAEMTAAQLL